MGARHLETRGQVLAAAWFYQERVLHGTRGVLKAGPRSGSPRRSSPEVRDLAATLVQGHWGEFGMQVWMQQW